MEVIMALDGLVVSNLVYELNNLIIDGRINKISQPENDELIITVKANRELIRLLISANPSLPLIYVSKENKTSPMNAPNFCMLLRKHLNSAKIVSITQPSLERVMDIKIEHYNELGDLCTKHIIVELMGKHSNIIFTDDDMNIIDSIKHISAMISSVREVLPGRKYFIPDNSSKLDPFSMTFDDFYSRITAKDIPVYKAIYLSITGISPLIASSLCESALISSDDNVSVLNQDTLYHLYNIITMFIEEIKANKYSPNIIYKDGIPIEFSSVLLKGYNDGYTIKKYDNISELLYDYYSQKNAHSRIHQKSADLRKITQTAIERTSKKLDLQIKQLNDTSKRDKYKVYGDLLMAYAYDVAPKSKSYTCNNFYDNDKPITIPLDEAMSATENGKKYFSKYSKLKRTFEALTLLVKESKEELLHLESISNSLDIATCEEDLNAIKKELMDFGYIRFRKDKNQTKKKKKNDKNTGKPFHYITSGGLHIYIGRNNYQNDELTFKFATGNDWWFHSKTIAGSHVILKWDGNDTPPDEAFEEAACAAAYYSKGRLYDKVEVDYIQKKFVKKPNGAKPGFVIYHTNYSMVAKPDISKLTLVDTI